MSGLFILIGTLAAGVGFWWVVINFFRKRSKKRPALIFVVGFVFILIGGAFAEEPVEKAEEKVEEKEIESAESDEKAVAKELSQEEKDAEAAAKKKAEEEKAAAEKAEAEKDAVAEKEYYLNEIKTKADTQMGMYDEAWSTLWVDTFNGVSDGSVDIFTAYTNMKQLKQRNETLQSSIPAIPDEGLSDEHKELLTEFKNQMVSAAQWRASASEKAMEMFDAGDFSPSEMDNILSEVKQADNEMINAVVSLTSLELELGVDREE